MKDEVVEELGVEVELSDYCDAFIVNIVFLIVPVLSYSNICATL